MIADGNSEYLDMQCMADVNHDQYLRCVIETSLIELGLSRYCSPALGLLFRAWV